MQKGFDDLARAGIIVHRRSSAADAGSRTAS
jgi:hypothetical protein